MDKYEKKLKNGVNIKTIDNNLICIYGNEYSSNYFIKIDELFEVISKEKYDDEYFIEKAIITEQNQKGKTYTFFRDDRKEDLINKYNWCQRPCDTNMSLNRFGKNGEIFGHMSESLAEEHGLVQIDLNEFIYKFVQVILKENIELKENSIGKDKIREYMKEHRKIYGMKTPNKNRVIYRNCILTDDLEELLKGE